MQGEEKKTVLIVDNNEDALQMLQGVLESAGFDTETTWSGREALVLLESRGFDVLLVDDYLPDLHSNDFLNRVRRLPMLPPPSRIRSKFSWSHLAFQQQRYSSRFSFLHDRQFTRFVASGCPAQQNDTARQTLTGSRLSTNSEAPRDA